MARLHQRRVEHQDGRVTSVIFEPELVVRASA
jgi:hypothetical protein